MVVQEMAPPPINPYPFPVNYYANPYSHDPRHAGSYSHDPRYAGSYSHDPRYAGPHFHDPRYAGSYSHDPRYAGSYFHNPRLNEEFHSPALGTKRSTGGIGLGTSSEPPEKLRAPMPVATRQKTSDAEQGVPKSPAQKQQIVDGIQRSEETSASMLAFGGLSGDQLKEILSNPDEVINEASRVLILEEKKKSEKEGELLELKAMTDEAPVANMLASDTRQKMSEAKGEEQSLTNCARRPPFRFYHAQVPIGSELVFTRDRSIKCEVLDDRNIKFRGKTTTLSAAAAQILGQVGWQSGKNVSGSLYWSYKGKSLDARRRHFEKKPESATQEQKISGAKREEQSLTNCARRPPFRFSHAQVPIGSELEFTRDRSIKCEVLDERLVRFRGKPTTLSGAAAQILHPTGWQSRNNLAGPLYWLYEGESLDARRRHFEENPEDGRSSSNQLSH